MHLQYFHISFFFIDQIIIIGGKMTNAMEGTEVIHVNDIGYDNLIFSKFTWQNNFESLLFCS